MFRKWSVVNSISSRCNFCSLTERNGIASWIDMQLFALPHDVGHTSVLRNLTKAALQFSTAIFSARMYWFTLSASSDLKVSIVSMFVWFAFGTRKKMSILPSWLSAISVRKKRTKMKLSLSQRIRQIETSHLRWRTTRRIFSLSSVLRSHQSTNSLEMKRKTVRRSSVKFFSRYVDRSHCAVRSGCAVTHFQHLN